LAGRVLACPSCSGLEESRVDAEGWNYGFDFVWLEYPPHMNGNTMTLATFVRRRRWTRCRLPVNASTQQPLLHIRSPILKRICSPNIRSSILKSTTGFDHNPN
jgi:hypothetical protein